MALSGSLNKTVSLRIVADAGTAKETLDDITAKADNIDGKKSSLTVRVNSGDTKEQLDEITAKADALGIKSIRFRVMADTSKAKSGLGDLEKAGSNLTGLFGNLNSGISSMGAAIPTLSLGIGGLAVAVIALIGPVAAIAAGIGAFGLVAFPTFDKLKNALTTTGAAGKKAYDALDPSQRGLFDQIRGLQGAFDGLTKSMQPQVEQVFAEGLKLVRSLLPDIRPLAMAGAKGLDEMLKSFAVFANSPQVKQFVALLAQHAPAAIKVFGDVIIWSTRVLGWLIEESFKWDHNVAITIQWFERAGAAVGRMGQNIGNAISVGVRAFERFYTGVFSVYSRVIGAIGRLPGQIASIFAGAGSWLFDAGWNIMVGLWNGLLSVGNKILGWVENFGNSIINKFKSVLSIFSPSRVFHQLGQYIVLGLANGITESQGLATNAVGRVGQALTGALRVTPPSVAGVGGRAGNGAVNNITVNVQGIVGDAGATGRQIAQSLNTYLRQTGQAQLIGAGA